MSYSIDVNKLKEEFRSDILKKEFNLLVVRKLEEFNDSYKGNTNLNLEEKGKYKGDLTKLISCSKNYFEDLIKIYVDEERVLEVSNNLKLNIFGSGLVYIVVTEDVSLSLNFIEDSLNKKNKDNFVNDFIFVKILVKKGKNLDLVDYSKNNNLYKNIQIVLEDCAELNRSQFVLGSKSNLNNVRLFKNSIYNLKSAFRIDSSNLYLENKSTHLYENSKTNMLVKGVSLNGANVINNGNIKIEKYAVDSVAHQNLFNLILDSKSSIKSDPELEVLNSKIECSHGSSISRIDDEILFYFKSKGIGEEKTKKIIIDGYFNEVNENIGLNSFKFVNF